MDKGSVKFVDPDPDQDRENYFTAISVAIQ
jgi:hypothetical protein